MKFPGEDETGFRRRGSHRVGRRHRPGPARSRHVAEPLVEQQDVDRPSSEDLVCDVEIASPRVPCLSGHPRSLAPATMGTLSSQDGATPSPVHLLAPPGHGFGPRRPVGGWPLGGALGQLTFSAQSCRRSLDRPTSIGRGHGQPKLASVTGVLGPRAPEWPTWRRLGSAGPSTTVRRVHARGHRPIPWRRPMQGSRACRTRLGVGRSPDRSRPRAGQPEGPYGRR